MSTEFDNVTGFDGWSGALAGLLEAAQDASAGDDLAKRTAVARRLGTYILKSPPGGDFDALDDIAKQTAIDLLKQNMDERNQAIMKNVAELASLTKTLQAGARANLTAAGSIRLERARAVVDHATDTVRALTELRASLNEETDEELAKKLENLVRRLQDLRNLVEAES
jgi:flagellin-specific chaperone FliS